MPAISIYFVFLIWLVLGLILGVIAKSARIKYSLAVCLAGCLPLILFLVCDGIPDKSYGWGIYALPTTIGAVTLIYTPFYTQKKRYFLLLLWFVANGLFGLPAFFGKLDEALDGRGRATMGFIPNKPSEYDNVEIIYSLIYVSLSLALLLLVVVAAKRFERHQRVRILI